MVLGFFHIYLLIIGQTTHEDIKKIFPDYSESPYYFGCIWNIFNSLCGPRFPGSINFQEQIDSDNVLFNEVIEYKDESMENNNTIDSNNQEDTTRLLESE